MTNNKYYYSKINKSLEYISKHLSEDIKIEQLAQISHFSLFHFQRIYKAVLNETPYESLLRLRLEKAVFLLKYKHELSITNIAFESGFPSPENFSRQFKSRYTITPSSFRKNKDLQNSKIYQESIDNSYYHCIKESRSLPSQHFDVSIESIPAIKIAYIKAIFGSDGSQLIERYQDLIDWAINNGVNYQGVLTRFGMSIDNPDVTPADKYRYDFALRLDKEITLPNHIELGEIPAGQYATIHCIGKINDVAQAWDFLYKVWLAQSDYIPIHYPAIEEFIKGPEEIGWEDFNIKCRVPIEKKK